MQHLQALVSNIQSKTYIQIKLSHDIILTFTHIVTVCKIDDVFNTVNNLKLR